VSERSFLWHAILLWGIRRATPVVRSIFLGVYN
jgi:hypothetical protein